MTKRYVTPLLAIGPNGVSPVAAALKVKGLTEAVVSDEDAASRVLVLLGLTPDEIKWRLDLSRGVK